MILAAAAGFAEQVIDAAEVAARTSTPAASSFTLRCVLVTPCCFSLTRRRGGVCTRACFKSGFVALRYWLPVVERGAAVVTPPTPFYGSLTLARVEDLWGNLWWLYHPVPDQPDPTLRGRVDRMRSSAPSTTTCAPADS